MNEMIEQIEAPASVPPEHEDLGIAGYHLLLICAALQDASGAEPFSLSYRTAGGLIGRDHFDAGKLLKGMVIEGYPKATWVSTRPPFDQQEAPEAAPVTTAKPMSKALAARLETARKARDRRLRDGAVPTVGDKVLHELDTIPVHRQEEWIRAWAKSEGGGLLGNMRRTVAGWWLAPPTTKQGRRVEVHDLAVEAHDDVMEVVENCAGSTLAAGTQPE